ncbi:Putative ribonuclease H protein At1g65750, partial [Linum perenne]
VGRFGDGCYLSTLYSGLTALSIPGGGGGGGGGGGLCAFWLDFWAGGGVRLSDAYPRIAAASQSLESNIADFVLLLNGRRHWQIPLNSTLRGGALREWNQLQLWLTSLPVDKITEGPASIIWPLENSAKFSVKSMRKKLVEEKFIGVSDCPHGVIWAKGVPSKVQSFVWLVWHKKIATIDNLQKRGMQMPNMCVLCYEDLESVDHIMLSCAFTLKVWARLSSRLSFYGPSPIDTRGFVAAWKGMNCASPFCVVMDHLLHATFWFLWLERNNRIFKDKAMHYNQVSIKILVNIGNWLSAGNMFSQAELIRWSKFVFDPG